MIFQEPPPGCVITWLARYTDGGRQYQYAAVHIAGRGWYTTDTLRPSPWAWPMLQSRIANAPCYVASGWLDVAHVLDGDVVTFALPAGGAHA